MKNYLLKTPNIIGYIIVNIILSIMLIISKIFIRKSKFLYFVDNILLLPELSKIDTNPVNYKNIGLFVLINIPITVISSYYLNNIIFNIIHSVSIVSYLVVFAIILAILLDIIQKASTDYNDLDY